jgi:hypothetical protein
MGLGLTLVGIGNLLCAWATGMGGYPAFAAAMAVTGAGAGLLNGDTQKNIMACVPRERTGMASGMSTTMRFSAIMLAIGVYGALLASHTLGALKDTLATVAPDLLDQAEQIASRAVAGDMNAALQTIDASARGMIQPLARDAFVSGFGSVLWVSGLIALLAAVLVGTLMRKPIPLMQLKTA